ncbi:hypothetical protein G210_1627 [Candida maltosa Xu316]|uniref:YMC020W-like alpha/beta hydrolase domain-containing protein n=1 Tax=Candida maltosa (strain Xu316) TaxID=1245528 RepID=M3JY47_CANMX|nr:hypothetical protein G210_1627 [Candida maltosa Xu316]
MTIFTFTKNEPTEETPLLHQHVSKESTPQQHPQSQQQQGSWWNWLIGSSANNIDDLEEEDGSNISNLELYKSARMSIETSKETSHYIFHNSSDSKNTELSVFGTLTEGNPVSYNSRKRPLLPTEVLENAIIGSHHRTDSVSSTVSVATDTMNTTHTSNDKIYPLFDDNYRETTWKTKIRILSEDVICGYKSEFHLYKNTPKNILKKKNKQIKRITIIGVHSFLPNKMVRALIGQNTGNSIRFVNKASKSVINWLRENNPDFALEDYTIDSLSIEGQGKMQDRIEKSMILIKNWMHLLESSDFIYMVSFGTSCTFAMNFLARLLTDYPHISKNTKKKKIGVLCMNGNFGGPIIGLDSKLVVRAFTSLENEIIKELFEYSKWNSKLSLQLNESIKRLIEDHNVKMTFTGHVNDCFIPLNSSLGIQFIHPNIRRSLYETEPIPFVSKLLNIICMMNNLGYYNDYNLIKDLSDKLDFNSTGRMFSDEKVYHESVKFILESTNLIHHQDLKIRYRSQPLSNDVFFNLLPWNLRSLFQDLIKIKHIQSVRLIIDLVDEFNHWNPNNNSNKNYKDMKYCLNFFEDFELNELIV